MQPDNQSQFAFLSEQEDELLFIMKKLSPAQKSAISQYLVDYTNQQTQIEQQKQTEPTR